jgi:hypothetical protein
MEFKKGVLRLLTPVQHLKAEMFGMIPVIFLLKVKTIAKECGLDTKKVNPSQ